MIMDDDSDLAVSINPAENDLGDDSDDFEIKVREKNVHSNNADKLIQ